MSEHVTMPYLIKNGRVIDPYTRFDKKIDLYLRGGRVEAFYQPGAPSPAEKHIVVDAEGLVVCPGLVDIHVHLREPGQTHKEDIASGCLAAVLGGVTSLICMPNTTPPADSPAVLSHIRARAEAADLIKVYPAGALTEGLNGKHLTDFTALGAAGARALSDDGCPVRDGALMEQALLQAAQLNLPVLSHCEPETEQAVRDIALSEKTSCPVHICHVSRKETVAAIRAAKTRGVPVTGETCPHYLWFTEEDVPRIGTNAKMNPPLATEADREAVIAGLLDGTLDALATDHAPHHPSEKSLPFAKAPNGVIGLETLLPAALTAMYHTGQMELLPLLALMTCMPTQVARLPPGRISPGQPADLLLFDPEPGRRVEARLFASKSANTPFEGVTLRGRVVHVFVDGKQRVKYGRPAHPDPPRL